MHIIEKSFSYDKHEVKKQMIPKRLCPWSLIEITPPHISGQAPAPFPPPFPSSNFPHLKCLSASSSRFRVRVTPCLLSLLLLTTIPHNLPPQFVSSQAQLLDNKKLLDTKDNILLLPTPPNSQLLMFYARTHK